MSQGNNKPRRVLLLIDDLSCGGAQQLAISLAIELRRQGRHALVAALHPQEELAPRLRAAGVPYICFGKPRPSILTPWRFAGYVLSCLAAIRRIIRDEGVEFISAHLSDAEFLGLAASWLDRTVSTMVTVHTPHPLPVRPPYDPRNGLRVWLTRRLFNGAFAVAPVSEEIALVLREVFGINPRVLRVITNGVDTAALTAQTIPAQLTDAQRPPDGLVLCNVGRLAHQKNQAVLFAVLARLQERGIASTLLIAGEGELRQTLAEQCAAAGLSDRVFFLGRREDVAAVIAASDIFVLPSWNEGASLALLEAMAVGRPIVASDVPGNRDILRHEETALLCPPDDPDAIAAAIARLTTAPDLARRLTAAAQREVREKYDISTTAAAYAALWDASLTR
jgi:glycosyltransferase involved in cell wall biosynthesis